MKIVATICSKNKLEIEGELPAQELYTAPHIVDTKKIADEEGLDFYILSGLYGLIPGTQKIPFYDYYLEPDAVPELIDKVVEQLEEAEITEIDFYYEDKESWKPYINSILGACERLEVKLNLHNTLE